MPTGNFFNGMFTRRPRAAARVDDTGLAPISNGPVRTIAVIGISTGGQPKTPILFTNPSDAARYFVDGELLDAIRLAFAPSQENNGGGSILGLRVNPATQATLTLKDGSAADSIVVTSSDWGLKENQKKIKVETGTTNGKKITLAYGSDVYSQDNLYRAVFSIQYIGAGSACTLTINGTTLTTVVTGGPGNEALNADLSVYNTVQKLFDYIGTKSTAYSVTMLAPDPSAGTLNGLDFVTTQAIKASAYTVTDVLDACVDYLNGALQPLTKAARASGAGQPPANISYTYLAGGGDGTTLTSDWQACFDAIQQREIAFVLPVSGNAAIHAMGDVHVALMSQDGRRPRRQFCGGAAGEYTTTLTNYITRGQNLNSDRTALLWMGVKGYDFDTGVAITWPPYIAAAIPCGLQAGVPEIGDPITMKSIRATGLEWVPSGGEIEVAMANGGLIAELAENRGFYRIVRGLTTWLKNDNYNRCEISVGIAMDEVTRRVLEAVEIYLGQKGVRNLANRAASRTQTVLNTLLRDNVIVAWRDITVTIDGDVMTIEFACSPVLPVNFINVIIHAETTTQQVTISLAA